MERRVRTCQWYRLADDPSITYQGKDFPCQTR